MSPFASLFPHIWTIFDSPDDYPGQVVVRAFIVTPVGPVAAKDVESFDTVDEAREDLCGRGLTCVGRAADDPPAIVESWL